LLWILLWTAFKRDIDAQLEVLMQMRDKKKDIDIMQAEF
jgi:hypothetical protein